MRQLLHLCLTLGCTLSACHALAQRPNVLLIITDDQGYGDLSCHGNDTLQTPNLDWLADHSIRFDQFHVNPLCAPTRAALLTGRYSLRTGTHGVSRGAETMRSEEMTLGEVFRYAGWKTGYFGKWHNGEHFPYTPNGQGFEEFFGFNLGHWNNYFDTTIRSNNVWVATKGYLPDVLTDAALNFIEKNRNQPWFCYLSYNTPHSPFQCPDESYKRYRLIGLDPDLACVYAMCVNLDHNIKRIVTALQEWELTDNTILLFLTDNGPNTDRFNGGMRGRKGSFYLGGIRVPCFLRWPGRLPGAFTVTNIAAHVDILPTLADLCQIDMRPSQPLDGVSLMPLLTSGTQTDWPDRMLFFQNSPATGKRRPNGSVRTQTHALVNEGGQYQLFDLTTDPGQKKDIKADQPELADKLITAYEAWLAEVSLGVTNDRPPIPVGYMEAPVVELPAAQAELGGGVKFSGRYPNNAWATNWVAEGANVEWRMNVTRPGSYQATLRYLNKEPASDVNLAITCGGHRVEVTPPATDRKQVPSPDRVPRMEVYEMVWHDLDLGVFDLEKGPSSLQVTALTASPTFELKSVLLERQREQPQKVPTPLEPR